MNGRPTLWRHLQFYFIQPASLQPQLCSETNETILRATTVPTKLVSHSLFDGLCICLLQIISFRFYLFKLTMMAEHQKTMKTTETTSNISPLSQD